MSNITSRGGGWAPRRLNKITVKIYCKLQIVPRGTGLHGMSVDGGQVIAQESWTLRQLMRRIDRIDDCLVFLAERRLLANEVACGICGQPASFVQYAEGVDGKRWSCRGCGFRQSVRRGSFFEGSHLTLFQVVLSMYLWAHDEPQERIMHEARVDRRATIIDWCNFFRDECETWVENNSGEIGGIDDNGDAVVVEVDESKYFHRKYHRGQWREGHWVFGGIERGSRACSIA